MVSYSDVALKHHKCMRTLHSMGERALRLDFGISLIHKMRHSCQKHSIFNEKCGDLSAFGALFAKPRKASLRAWKHSSLNELQNRELGAQISPLGVHFNQKRRHAALQAPAKHRPEREDARIFRPR